MFYLFIYLFTLLDVCVSSLRRGHANLLCIVPILFIHSFIQGSTHAGRGSVTGARCTD